MRWFRRGYGINLNGAIGGVGQHLALAVEQGSVMQAWRDLTGRIPLAAAFTRYVPACNETLPGTMPPRHAQCVPGFQRS